MKLQFINLSLQESPKIIDSLLPLVQINSILIFEGAMGSGKTSLIKTICSQLGVTDKVNSPTYSLVNEYQTHDGKIIYHFDLYRINDLSEAFDMGIEEYLYSGNLCLIEWPNKIMELLPKHYLKVSINYNEENRNYLIEQI